MTARRIDYSLITSLAGVVIAGVYAGLRLTSAFPPDGGAVVYGFVWVYNYTALPASILVVLAALTALFYWVPQAIVKRPGFRRDGALLLLALLAAAASVWAALPLGRTIYREVPNGTLAAAGRTYHLGVRVSGDAAQNAYTLCDCPGPVCECRYLYDESLKTLEPLPALKVDPAGRIVVQVSDRILHEEKP